MPKAQPVDRRYQHLAIEDAFARLGGSQALRAVLDSPDVTQRLEAFEAADAAAVRHQARYRRLGSWAIVLTTLATLLGAIVLLPLEVWIGDLPRNLMSGVQSLALLVTLVVVWLIGHSNCVEAWMTSRAEAERLRGDLFDALLATPGPSGTPLGTLLKEKLALIMAAHLNYQESYFSKSALRHRIQAGNTSRPRLLSYAASALAVLIGLVASANHLPLIGIAPPDWLARLAGHFAEVEATRWQLGLGTIAASLLAYASARTQMDQDERNAALYATTAARLAKHRSEHLGAAETSAGNGDIEAVEAFLRNGQDILAADHLAWYVARPPADPTAGAPKSMA